MKYSLIFIFILSISITYLNGNSENPKACISGKRNGNISKNEILKYCKLGVINNKSERFKISSFEMWVTAKGMDIWGDKSNSDSLTRGMIQLISSLGQKNYPCKLWFQKIIIQDRINEKTYLDSMVFILK